MEEKNIFEQYNIYQLLQDVRNELTKIEIKKSGYNSFAKFGYFELKDFLPITTKLFKERGMTPLFSIAYFDGIEYALLKIIRGNEQIEFRVPTAEPSGNNPIQNLGAKITYLRRYLYLIALDLVENDVVDAMDNTKEPKVVVATPLQVKTIMENKEKLIEQLKAKGIKNQADVKKLSMQEAQELIDSVSNNEN